MGRWGEIEEVLGETEGISKIIVNIEIILSLKGDRNCQDGTDGTRLSTEERHTGQKNLIEPAEAAEATVTSAKRTGAR